MHAPKLRLVHRILRWGAVSSALLLTTLAVMLSGDTAADPPVIQSRTANQLQAPFGMSAGGGRDSLITHQWVIPLGRKTISFPILMYHYIRPAHSTRTDRLGYNLTVTPANFQAQMAWLANNGYHPVDFNDIRAYFAGKTPLPGKPVVITLDDGYRDLYTTAYPVLRAFRFKAVAYIVSGFVDRPSNVSSAQIVEMANNGIEIAGHTVNHANLARSSLPLIMYQLQASKAWLQHLIGQPVIDFAYPSGKFNATVVQALQAAGYDTATTEISGTHHSRADRYTWTRVRVWGGEGLHDFITNLGRVEPMVEITEIVDQPIAP